MAKSSKKIKQSTVSEPAPSSENQGDASMSGAEISPIAKKKAQGRPDAKPRAKRARAQGRKATGGGKEKTPRAGVALISDDQIRLRAYFIAEWRMQNGIKGDSAHDWLEARRQLQEEAGQGA